jgi:hypothetical protein
MNDLKKKQQQKEESKRQLKNTIVQFIKKNPNCSLYQLLNALPSHKRLPTSMYGVEEMNLLLYPIPMRSDVIVALNELTRDDVIGVIPTSFVTYLLDGIYFDGIPIVSKALFLEHTRNEHGSVEKRSFSEKHWIPVVFCIVTKKLELV